MAGSFLVQVDSLHITQFYHFGGEWDICAVLSRAGRDTRRDLRGTAGGVSFCFTFAEFARQDALYGGITNPGALPYGLYNIDIIISRTLSSAARWS